ncbi:hypothetical protein JK361_10045 [Streptomyces sp. 5-8]|uniref:DUF4760 domain-containing protein n=1 Tax=Streptomyces musisoli TaxID=2802280 RepID=A0ABS1NXV7_9ACTN|nr:hypothetical protein [Streptomyces musisoli]MBL1104931.1 hypothetical protein [Streptomyces musisoli]
MPQVITAAYVWDTWWFGVAAISQAVVAGGVLLGLVGLKQARKLRIRGYEDRFEERYQALMERLSLAALRGATQDPPPAELTERDQKAVRSYFRLCETQLNMRAEGWVTDATWDLWEHGITDRMSHWPFTRVWNEILADPLAGHLYARLREFKAGVTDPCTLSDFRRWWRGLTGKSRR